MNDDISKTPDGASLLRFIMSEANGNKLKYFKILDEARQYDDQESHTKGSFRKFACDFLKDTLV